MYDVDPERIPMWVVYQNPKDYPGHTLARLWYHRPETEATQTIIVGNLQVIRAAMLSRGYFNLGREDGDDPCILGDLDMTYNQFIFCMFATNAALNAICLHRRCNGAHWAEACTLGVVYFWIPLWMAKEEE